MSALADNLAALCRDDWQYLVRKVAWMYRQGVDMPAPIVWAELRGEVSTRRYLIRTKAEHKRKLNADHQRAWRARNHPSKLTPS